MGIMRKENEKSIILLTINILNRQQTIRLKIINTKSLLRSMKRKLMK